jgi:glycosyltransferase involved in cell wall biosynthesis
MATYARAIITNVLRLLEETANREDEVVFYGDAVVLSEDMLKRIALAPVLSVVRERGLDYGAGAYFRLLPNGARCQILARRLPAPFGRYAATIFDQVAVPYWAWRDGVDVLLGTANFGSLLWRGKQGVIVHDLFQGWAPAEEEAPALWRRAARRWYRFHFKRQFRRLSLTIAVSPAVAKEVTDRFKLERGRVATLKNGVDEVFEYFPKHRERKKLQEEWRQEKKLPEGYTLVLAASDERKNLPRLVQAWKGLPPELRKRGLVVNLLDERAKKMALDLLGDEIAEDYVYFLKDLPRHEVPVAFSLAGALLVATLAEGFGLPAVEGLAAGTRVVTGPVSSVEGVEDTALFLCDPKSEASIREALQRALEVPETKAVVGEAGRGRGRGEPLRTMFDTVRDIFSLIRGVQLRPMAR